MKSSQEFQRRACLADIVLVQQQVRPLKQGYQHGKDDQLPFPLLLIEGWRHLIRKEPEIRILQRDLQEILIAVRQELVHLFFFVLALLPLLEQEHGNGQWQAYDGHHVAQQFPGFHCHGYTTLRPSTDRSNAKTNRPEIQELTLIRNTCVPPPKPQAASSAIQYEPGAEGAVNPKLGPASGWSAIE